MFTRESFTQDELTFFILIRQRRMLLDAILSIEEVLKDPNHGGYQSDLWSGVDTVISQLKRDWGKP